MRNYIFIIFLIFAFTNVKGQQLLLGKTQSEIIDLAHDKKWKLYSTSKPVKDSIFKEKYTIKKGISMEVEYDSLLKCIKAIYSGSDRDYLQIISDLDKSQKFKKVSPNEWQNDKDRIKAKVWAETVNGNTTTKFECFYY